MGLQLSLPAGKVLKKSPHLSPQNDDLTRQVYGLPSPYMKTNGGGLGLAGLLPCLPMNVLPGPMNTSILHHPKITFSFPRLKEVMLDGDGYKVASGRSTVLSPARETRELLLGMAGYTTTIA
jgi:hypothetical protein